MFVNIFLLEYVLGFCQPVKSARKEKNQFSSPSASEAAYFWGQLSTDGHGLLCSTCIEAHWLHAYAYEAHHSACFCQSCTVPYMIG